ncbi:hypothetical protein [Noviherbaspirillum cavernae]|uniref:hypothetical protein n=1 Tax=Noviherbaspirillum cavernae TaxID=2320862 RepID=UPI0011C3FB3C|nr:hypothetical protein [Noviherbaspirillum cavernae]
MQIADSATMHRIFMLIFSCATGYIDKTRRRTGRPLRAFAYQNHLTSQGGDRAHVICINSQRNVGPMHRWKNVAMIDYGDSPASTLCTGPDESIHSADATGLGAGGLG